ncbi:MAG: hypothetical protein IPL50_19335 [Chitinophagaceae bacterium]|nr:hypothetical protein [Chitinophagaceae bacterium]
MVIPPGATYGIALQGLTAGNAANIAYTNGGALVTYTDGGCTITTGGNVGYGGVAAPGAPTFNPRNFNGSVSFLGSGAGTCTPPGQNGYCNSSSANNGCYTTCCSNHLY